MAHHGAGLRALLRASGHDEGKIDAQLTALERDHRGAGLSSPDRAMLDYAIKLTARPSEMVQADVEHLRSVGFDDRAIHDICAITGYYAFVNRMADGLGVELEARFRPGEPP